MSWQNVDLETLRQAAHQFASDRDWHQFHDIRSLLLAVCSEVGEAADLVRWRRDSDAGLPNDIASDWQDELGDIFILLVRLADVSGVDLGQAFQQKLAKANEKYPVASSHGRNVKYDQLDNKSNES